MLHGRSSTPQGRGKRGPATRLPRRRLGALLISLLALVALVVAAPASAAPGALDPAFGAGGLVETNFAPASLDEANGVAIQPDGKVVAVGFSRQGDTEVFAIARYNADGSLDGTFGTGGIATATACPSWDASAQAVALQADGKIVVAGWGRDSGCDVDSFEVARFLPNGTLDPSFGTGGIAVASGAFPNTSHGLGVALQSDGTIVTVGFAYQTNTSGQDSNEDFAVVRFDPSGAVVSHTSVDIGQTLDDEGRAALVLPDDSILAAGYSENTGVGKDFILVHVRADGTVSSARFTDFEGGDDVANAIAMQPDGKIVLAGFATSGAGDQDFALARYDNGTPDTSFNGTGTVVTALGDPGTSDHANAVAVQPDGKIVVGGYATRAGTSQDFAVARYDTTGALDGAFGTGGLTLTDFFGGNDEADALALQADGGIVLAGFVSPGVRIARARLRDVSSVDFALARYLGDPPSTPAGGGGGGGSVTTVPVVTPATALSQSDACANDVTGPTVTIASLENTHTYGRGQAASVAVTASDPSGLSVDPSVQSKTLSTGAVGRRLFWAVAVDRCGNRTQANFLYRVIGRLKLGVRGIFGHCVPSGARVSVLAEGHAPLRHFAASIDGRPVLARALRGLRTVVRIPLGAHRLRPGAHTLTVTVRDRLGNERSHSHGFVVCGALTPKFTG